MVDHQNKNPLPPKACSVIGEATADFTLIETGEFPHRRHEGQGRADVALFLDNGNDGKDNGKGVSARFRPQTTNDVIRALPDMKHGESGVLQVVDMTGENLLRTLEYAIPPTTTSEDGSTTSPA